MSDKAKFILSKLVNACIVAIIQVLSSVVGA